MAVSMSMPILIVDDYNTMIRILRNLLRQLGFTQIDEACDGATALQKLRNKDYALVISDSVMAPMSGAELLQRVRADERTRETPFVMVGDDADDADAAANNTACLIRPFGAQMLKSKLVPVLGPF
jgi:two-component system chemotaxis response regulator CheY